MKHLALNILAVDDEEFNLDIMGEYFRDARFNVEFAKDGIEALEILRNKEKFDVIVLDRMMPRMDGMEFLKIIKENHVFKDIPVIMQTAAGSATQIIEGIKAGVYYYLSKPYNKDVLLAIIRAANDDHKARLEAKSQIEQFKKAMLMVVNAEFRFKTINEARLLSIMIGSTLPEPEAASMGLMELMVNAIEHGNLSITYEEKLKLKLQGEWDTEINRRMNLKEFANRFCSISIKKDTERLIVNIRDQGRGFNWQEFIEFDPSRLTDPNGRGIMMAMHAGFSTVKYLGNGNEVECVVVLKP